MTDLPIKPRLPPDLQYVIDGMTEYCELDSGSARVLEFFGDRDYIDTLLNAPAPPEVTGLKAALWEHSRGRRNAEALARHAWDIAREMPIEKQAVLAGMGLVHHAFNCTTTARCMAEWSIGDFAEGGYGEGRQLHWTRDGITPKKRNLRRLHSPAWIRRHVKRDSETWSMRRRHGFYMDLIRHIPHEMITFDLTLWRAAFKDERQRQTEAEAEQWRRAREISEATELPWIDVLLEPKITLKPKALKQMRAFRRRRNKVARRALATAETILGSERTRRLVNNRSLLIEGREIDFNVRRYSHPAETGHGVMGVTAYDKQGNELAQLCLYYQDTPMLEQAASLALEVEAGDECAVLATANIVEMFPAGMEHPLLTGRHHARPTPLDVDAPIDVSLTPAGKRVHRDQTYWQETAPIWVEAVRVQTFGRDAKLLPPQQTVGYDGFEGLR
jgi:hypothetical protein